MENKLLSQWRTDIENNPIGWSYTAPLRENSGERVAAQQNNPGYFENLVEYLKKNPSKYQTKQMLRDALQYLAQGPMALEKAHKGRYTGDMRELVDDLVPAMLPFSGASFSGAVTPGTLLSIGGVNAAKAPREAFRFAEKMERAGAKPETIWKGYQIFRDKAGNMKFEIPDDGMRLNVIDDFRPEYSDQGGRPGFYTSSPQSWAPKNDAPRGWQSTGDTRLYPYFTDKTRVGDVLEHPKLFEQYPHLQNLLIAEPLDFTGSLRGAYDPTKKKMYMAPGDLSRVPQTFAHELGHAVQHFEETPMGGNPGQFLPKDYQNFVDMQKRAEELFVDRAKKYQISKSDENALRYLLGEPRLSKHAQAILKDYEDNFPDLFAAAKGLLGAKKAKHKLDSDAYEAYRSLHGEQEAEAIARRVGLSQRERTTRPFWEDYTLPIDNHLMGNIENWIP